ncbi:hypothetical protein [Vibrio sp. SCSIO 43137]|uniref:hypothetical protein n=1 Tax=Vibrio sp. SCSIO 43137 TaxID=3021011 RepID=UPI0023073140|nr:hypothetical protein [Vibrio sp. SCSIO 43137]WCE28436.1 hypothetical protein PK654_08610 [Vibrio sp. SCSIO 43137]
MKVIYKKSMTEKVYEAVREAKQLVKDIDYIELTNDEFDQLLSEHHAACMLAIPTHHHYQLRNPFCLSEIALHGVTVKREVSHVF